MMKSPSNSKAKSLLDTLKKSKTSTASSFVTSRNHENSAANSSSPAGSVEDGELSLSKQKKRRRSSSGVKKSLLSHSFKKNSKSLLLEKSMRGHTLSVNNRSLANQVQGLKTQLRTAQDEIVEKSREVNELTARVRRLEVIDDQERFELLVQERVKQELALLVDLMRETAVGLSRSADKLNNALTISQRMQLAQTTEDRTLLVPRTRILLPSPQERNTRLPALFDRQETQSSVCGPTIRKRSSVPMELRKISSLQEEMHMDEDEKEPASVQKPQLPSTAEDPISQLSIIDEVTEESPFAKKDKVPRTPAVKTPAHKSIWEEPLSTRREQLQLSPPRPLRPMSPGLAQIMYQPPKKDDNSLVHVDESDEVVVETPFSSSDRSNDTLTEPAADLSFASPAKRRKAMSAAREDDDDELDESSFIKIRPHARSRRRNISSDDDNESPDVLASEPLSEEKDVSPAKKTRFGRRGTFVVEKPTIHVHSSPVDNRDSLPTFVSRLPVPLTSSSRVANVSQSPRSSPANRRKEKASTTSSPAMSPRVSSNSRESTASPLAETVVPPRTSPRFFKEPTATGEQTASPAAQKQAPYLDIFDLSHLSADVSPDPRAAAGKKVSTKPRSKAQKGKNKDEPPHSKTPTVGSPAKKLPAKTKKGQLKESTQPKTPDVTESSMNSTFSVSIERPSRTHSTVRDPTPAEDDADRGSRAVSIESSDGDASRTRSRRNALKVTSFKEASLNTKMRRV